MPNQTHMTPSQMKGSAMTTTEHITKLETSLRRQRMAITGLGLGLLATIAIGMKTPAPTELTIESLIITKDGQPRIAMGTNEKDGGVGMAFLDSKGVARVAMGTDVKGDGGIAVLDAKEATRILMGSGAEGTGIMVIGGGVTELPAGAMQ